jgi:hypothetical protein
MGLAGRWERWSLLEPLSVELAAVEISSLEIFFVRTDLKKKIVPTDGAKLLEHSFPRMTWKLLIRCLAGFV